jgi:hypothetical protein
MKRQWIVTGTLMAVLLLGLSAGCQSKNNASMQLGGGPTQQATEAVPAVATVTLPPSTTSPAVAAVAATAEKGSAKLGVVYPAAARSTTWITVRMPDLSTLVKMLPTIASKKVIGAWTDPSGAIYLTIEEEYQTPRSTESPGSAVTKTGATSTVVSTAWITVRMPDQASLEKMLPTLAPDRIIRRWTGSDGAIYLTMETHR